LTSRRSAVLAAFGLACLVASYFVSNSSSSRSDQEQSKSARQESKQVSANETPDNGPPQTAQAPSSPKGDAQPRPNPSHRPTIAGGPSVEGPHEGGEEDLPKFGAYVYVEELPEPMTKATPVYPEAARRAGVEGTVFIQALIGKDGLVKDTRVTKSIPELDAAAIEAVRQWRFKPALNANRPVAVWVAVPVKFSLK